MTKPSRLLAVPAFLIATSGLLMAGEIKDKAGMFSEAAVKKAMIHIDRIEKDYKVPVTIETINSLEGRTIDAVLPQHAKASGAHGLYVLMARDDHKIEADSEKTYKKSLTPSRLVAIREGFMTDFKKGNFDAGLAKGLDKIDSVLSEAKAAAGGLAPKQAKNSSSEGLMVLLYIGLGILALFIVIRVLGAIFSGGNRGGYAGQNRMMGQGGGMGGPGYGQPGYGGGGGGGGGGFMSSMFGGIGGALAGNWLYDQFSGRRHDSGMNQGNYDAGTPPADAGPDWTGPNDGGGDWGGGTSDAGSGGGDWGGGGDTGGGGGDWGGGGGDTGGGDWGGGGGGGDWGGGGGGDGGGW